MFRKTLNLIFSITLIASLLIGNTRVTAQPSSPVDETKVPHYFGPYPNWANSPQVLADAIVNIIPAAGDTTGTGAEAIATVDPKTGGITAVTVTSPGSGYTAAPTVEITAAGITPTTNAVATAAISLGVIKSITVDETGYGFTAPAVTITGGNPTPGFEATGTASGGVDDVHLVDGGSGYTIQPLVEFSLPNLPGGVQATGSATMDLNGVVDSIVVANPGSGYTSAPTVTIWDGTLTQAAATPATAVATIGIGQIDVTSGGEGYDTPPVVTISDTVGTPDKGASATATIATKGAVTDITVTTAGAGYLTPGLKKFVDTLPGLGPDAANDLGQYIPIAVPDTTTYPGSDYYEIAVVQYRMKFHRDLPPTLLRGYVQLSTSVVPGKNVPLSNASLDPNGAAAPINGYTGVDNPHYLGPTIVATKDKPVRILFRNLLPNGADGNLFLPVDTSMMGSGAGPDMMMLDENGVPMDMHPDEGTVMDMVRNPMCGQLPKPADCFTENRATLHLHGGITPWISDGTPHQWTTPAGEDTTYPQGVSVSNVPDMPDPGEGAITFFYTNQQSARLMFYHDHAWGITRLNVYAGEAAGYLITDDVEQKLIGTGGALEGLGTGTPLIIQDKTFVPSPAKMAQLDPTWQYDRWGGEGSLWAPHVYMPAQNPGDPSGMSAFGRWMYGPWFWPPAKDAKYPPIANPYYDPNCDPDVQPFCEPALIPSTPNVSVGMEAFNDTPVVNGAAYPTTTVDPKAYRYRILNAANDRFWNLSWYVADPRTGTLSEVALNPAELAAAQTDPVVSPTPDTAISPPGPSWIQIGTEGGFLPAPVVLPAHPTTWITDPTRFDVGNVDQHSLLLAPAERADVIVDFSQFRGKTLILYNDAPAAFPARVPGYDYYTGGPDLSPSGAPTTLPGYGPNTRTIMQVKVSNAAPVVAFDRPNTTADRMGALVAAFAHHADGSGVFEAGQNPIIVGQAAYNSAYGTSFVNTGWCNSTTNPTKKCDGYARIMEQGGNTFKFDTLFGAQLGIPLQPKGIHDEMNSANFDEWGRMTANIGLEAPGATPLLQNIILYPYVNPATELLDASGMPSSLDVTPISSAVDGTQIWKITHNGVDTHPLHFHLYDIQVINRVTWDNIIIPPDANELGWKDTVRVSPLEDTIVALRPIIPVLPFGVPESKRPLNPMMPIGARGTTNGPNGTEAGFNNTGTDGNPIAPIINDIVNFGWEYVWHCHILSHEEMDMMRPVSVHVPTTLPEAPVLTYNAGALSWTDGTPVTISPLTWGNLAGEIGYRIELAIGSGAFKKIGTALANVTTFTDNTAATDDLHYRVIAFNASGESVSNEVLVPANPPAAPSNLTANLAAGPQIDLAWVDNAADENGFVIERRVNNGNFTQIGTTTANVTTFSDTAVAYTLTADVYEYRVFAQNNVGPSGFSNTASVTMPYLPAAPTNLTALLGAGPKVDLAWVDNADNETSYVIERSDNSGPFTQIGTALADATTYSDTTVAYAVTANTYVYRVYASNAVGVSDFSNTASVIMPTLPSAPTNLTAGRLSNPLQISLSWTNTATDTTGFVIQRSTNGGSFVQIGTTAADVTTFSDPAVAYAVTANVYAYRVYAVNNLGSSPFSNTASVTMPMLPAAPGNLAARLLSTPTRVSLTWNNVANETGFIIQRRLNTGAFSQIGTTTANVTTFTDTTVVSALTANVYTYQVIAINAYGQSASSNTASVTMPMIPAAPTTLTAALLTNPIRVNLTWRDNATNETGFVIERSINGGAYSQIASVAARTGTGTVSYINTTVTPGNTYRYRVTALNGALRSATSNTATIAIATLPAAPTTLTSVLSVGPVRVTLTWRDNATNETGFIVQRSDNGGAFTQIATVGARTATGSATYTNTNVVAGHTYAYRIAATNATGPSTFSNTSTVIVPPAPAAPSSFTGTATRNGTTDNINLKWNDNSTNETGFVIQRSTNATFTTGIRNITVNANTTSTTLGSAPRGVTYYYRISAQNAYGSSAWVKLSPFPIVTP